MRIGIAQIETRAGELEGTCERIAAYARRAADQGVELLVVPMTALTGPLPAEYSELEGFLCDLRDALDDLSEKVPIPCLVPVVWDMDGDPMPEAMLVERGEVAPLKFMAYLGSLGSQEGDGGAAGNVAGGPAPDLPVLTVGDTTLGVAFTYDDLDDFVDYDLGVDAVVYLAGYGFAMDDPSSALGTALAENRYLGDARDMDAWLVGVGSLGGYGTQVFGGSSFVVTPWGEVAASAASFEEELLVCDIDPKAAGPLAHPLAPEVYNRPLYLWESLSLGLRSYVEGDPSVSGVALLLDGGVQSMLVATLATDALGPQRVHALVSPAVSDQERSWCREVAQSLRIQVAELSPRDVLPAGGGRDMQDEALVADLTQARLAQLARDTRSMVLGSADKTRLALELDGPRAQAEELMPLGDVYRSDVLELVRLRNAISPVIPLGAERSYRVPSLPGIAPTSGEGRLREMDLVLAGHLEGERSLSELVDHGARRDLAEAVLARLAQTERLRTGRVLYLMVSSRTLFDARRPLGLAWHDRYRAPGERVDEQDVWERLRRMGEELIGAAPASSERERDRAGEVRDILGYLRDFSLGGGRGDRQVMGSEDGGQGGGRWRNPFSDN